MAAHHRSRTIMASSSQIEDHNGSSSQIKDHNGSSSQIKDHNGSSSQIEDHNGSSSQIKDHNGQLITDPLEKSDVLNSYYASVFSCKRNNPQIQ